MSGHALGVVVAVAVVLAGCSTDDGGAPSIENGGESLANLAGNKMCELLAPATIEETFDVALATPFNPLAAGTGDEEREWTASCVYADADTTKETGEFFTLTAAIGPAEGATSAQDVLDEHFRAYDGGEPVDYQRVDGLGAGAGFADRNADVGPGRDHVLAVLDVDGALYKVQVDVTPTGSVDQLTTVAKELVDGLESEL